jgi:hypothetical protein
MSVIEFQRPPQKLVRRTARRVTLTEAICKEIKPEERVLARAALQKWQVDETPDPVGDHGWRRFAGIA